MCREAGARVATNVFVWDLDLGEVNGLDGRRLEVIADRLTLWRGVQLAIDTTQVSPLHSDGTAIRRAAAHDSAALEAARRRKDECTQSSLVMEGERVWWSLQPMWRTVVQRDSRVLVRIGQDRAGPKLLGSDAGVPCWRAVQQGRSPCPSSNSGDGISSGSVFSSVVRISSRLPFSFFFKKKVCVSFCFLVRFFPLESSLFCDEKRYILLSDIFQMTCSFLFILTLYSPRKW